MTRHHDLAHDYIPATTYKHYHTIIYLEKLFPEKFKVKLFDSMTNEDNSQVQRFSALCAYFLLVKEDFT